MGKRAIVYPVKTFKIMLFPASWLFCTFVLIINRPPIDAKLEAQELVFAMILLLLLGTTILVFLSIPIAGMIGYFLDKKSWLDDDKKVKSRWLKLKWVLIILPVFTTLIISTISYRTEEPIIYQSSVLVMQELPDHRGESYFQINVTTTFFRNLNSQSFEIPWEMFDVLEVDDPVLIVHERRFIGWRSGVVLVE